VSPTHAMEILSPAYGFNLDSSLRHRAAQGRLRGILNGIDVKEWNPETDEIIAAKYSSNSIEGKKICKRELQKRFSLPQRQDQPVFGLISRLAYQKGIDIFANAVDNVLMYDDAQFVVLASGNPGLEWHLKSIASRFPEKFSYIDSFDPELSHVVEAGADIFVMPSRYEPCGLNQMYSMRYGTLPLVRATGGLHDTVANYDAKNPSESTGFKFWDLYPESLTNSMRWAASVYRSDKSGFRKAQINAMSKDFSWNRTAGQYEDLYRAALGRI
ncbi:MAG TPA: glycogen/starch synthase, partial [Victivallales bacterium]|nr:glycogen/starch synthase [Victivallales bacterium]